MINTTAPALSPSLADDATKVLKYLRENQAPDEILLAALGIAMALCSSAGTASRETPNKTSFRTEASDLTITRFSEGGLMK